MPCIEFAVTEPASPHPVHVVASPKLSLELKAGFQPDGSTPGDFRNIFASCASEFHWLCFTLTGDEQRTRAAITAALEESEASAGLVFHEWMTKWARRLLLKSCITAMRAEIGTAARNFATSEGLQLRTSSCIPPLQARLRSCPAPRLFALHRRAVFRSFRSGNLSSLFVSLTSGGKR